MDPLGLGPLGLDRLGLGPLGQGPLGLGPLGQGSLGLDPLGLDPLGLDFPPLTDWVCLCSRDLRKCVQVLGGVYDSAGFSLEA